MPGRSYAVDASYRYGFNGKEKDNEVKGEGNQQDYGMRIYDPRLGRFLSVDPLAKSYPSLTPYQFASNRPIDGIDIDGKEYGTIHVSIDVFSGKTTYEYTPYDATNLHLYGPNGKGVEYNITRYQVEQMGNFSSIRIVENFNSFIFRGRGLTEYGNYMGATSIFKVNKDGSFSKEYLYAAMAIDAVDQAAKMHDMGYDHLGAVGAKGLFEDWATTPVDEIALNTWNDIIKKYKKGDKDPFTNQPISKTEYFAAIRGSVLFSHVVGTKRLAIARWMEANNGEESKMSFGEKNDEIERNYNQFVKLYLYKDEQGNLKRKDDMWKKDKDGNWIPIKTKLKSN